MRSGFSLLELLIVIAFVLIISAIFAPVIESRRTPVTAEIVREKTSIALQTPRLSSVNGKVCNVYIDDYARAEVGKEFKCRWHD